MLLPGGERPAPTEAGAETGAVACVPSARTHPSARGFGVDVEESTRERGRPGVARFFAQVRKRVVLVWYCDEIFRAKTGEKEREIPGEA